MEENRKPFKCNNCNKRFSLTRNFIKHTSECKSKMERNRENPFECSNCNKTFSHNYIRKHISICKRNEMLKETKGKRCFTCNICQRAFHLRIALKQHVNTHLHDGGKSVCDKCDKVFPSETVTDHVCVPASEIVFPCDECNSFFSSDASMMSHKFHSHTKKRNIVCVNCKKEFYSQYHLEQHQFQETCLYTGYIIRK